MYQQAEIALNSWQRWIPQPAERPQISGILTDGLTNQNFKLQTSHGAAVLRLAHPESDRLGIDRQREQKILKALRGQQVNTDVWFYAADTGVMVSRFVSGKAYSADQLNPSQKEQVLKLIARYQAINVDLEKFDYVAYLQKYRQQIQTHNPLWESEWRQFFPQLANWQTSGWKPVLCHHDLDGINLINSQGEWLLLDWEYAAMGHPAIDALSCGVRPDYLEPEAEKHLFKLMMWIDRYWRNARSVAVDR